MKIDGIKLLEKIRRKEIKANTKIKVYRCHEDFKGLVTTIRFDGTDIKWNPGRFAVKYFYTDDYLFEVLEEDKDIEVYDYCDNYEVMNNKTIANNFIHLNEDLKAIAKEVNKLKNK